MHVAMVSRAFLGKLLRNAQAICQEDCRLEDWSEGRSHTARSRYHSKLAHVSLHLSHVWVPLDLGQDIQLPAGGQPGMLVDEVLAVGPLVLVDRRAESQVSLDLLQQIFEPLHTLPVVLVHEDVDLPEAG